MRAYDMVHLVPDFIIPQQYYAVCYSVAEHDEEHDTSGASIMSSYQRAKGMNMKLEGYMVGRMIRYVQHAGTYASVNKMCFPIADE